MNDLSVLIVDDSAPIRERLALLVEAIPGVCVAGYADSLQEAVDEVEHRTPDVMLLDLALRKGNGFDVLEWLRMRPRRPVIIALTNFATPLFRTKALELGADHFFDKTSEFELAIEVLEALSIKHHSGDPSLNRVLS